MVAWQSIWLLNSSVVILRIEHYAMSMGHVILAVDHVPLWRKTLHALFPVDHVTLRCKTLHALFPVDHVTLRCETLLSALDHVTLAVDHVTLRCEALRPVDHMTTVADVGGGRYLD